MQFVIESTELNKALAQLKGIPSEVVGNPFSNLVLLDAQKDSVVFTAFDYEMSIVTEVPAKVKTPGKALLTFKAEKFINSLTGPVKVLLRTKGSAHTVEVSTGGGSLASFTCYQTPEDFPKVALPQAAMAPAPGTMLLEFIQRTYHAICQDTSRLNLCGAFFTRAKKKACRMVATDGHQMAYLERELPDVELPKCGVTIPREALRKLASLLKANPGEGWALGFHDGAAVFVNGGLRVTVRLIDSQFPDYTKVIPKMEGCAVVNRATLLRNLELVTTIASGDNGVRVTLSDDGVQLSVNNPELGEGTVSADATYPGPSRWASFNPRYLRDAIEAMGEVDELEMYLPEDRNQPCAFRPAGDHSLVAIVMPMRMRMD